LLAMRQHVGEQPGEAGTTENHREEGAEQPGDPVPLSQFFAGGADNVLSLRGAARVGRGAAAGGARLTVVGRRSQRYRRWDPRLPRVSTPAGRAEDVEIGGPVSSGSSG
jgi:hypothetical protein